MCRQDPTAAHLNRIKELEKRLVEGEKRCLAAEQDAAACAQIAKARSAQVSEMELERAKMQRNIVDLNSDMRRMKRELAVVGGPC